MESNYALPGLMPLEEHDPVMYDLIEQEKVNPSTLHAPREQIRAVTFVKREQTAAWSMRAVHVDPPAYRRNAITCVTAYGSNVMQCEMPPQARQTQFRHLHSHYHRRIDSDGQHFQDDGVVATPPLFTFPHKTPSTP